MQRQGALRPLDERSDIEEGYVVVNADDSVPAPFSSFRQVHYIKRVVGLSGKMEVAYVTDMRDDPRHSDLHRLRTIADDDMECDRAELWITQRQIYRAQKSIIEQGGNWATDMCCVSGPADGRDGLFSTTYDIS